MGMLSTADHKMHGCVMTADAISQPRGGENRKALTSAGKNHLSPLPPVRFLSEGIGKEATNLMRGGSFSSGGAQGRGRQ